MVAVDHGGHTTFDVAVDFFSTTIEIQSPSISYNYLGTRLHIYTEIEIHTIFIFC